MSPINQPVAPLISFYSGYEDAFKAISIHEQVIAISYRSLITSKHKYCIDVSALYSTKL